MVKTKEARALNRMTIGYILVVSCLSCLMQWLWRRHFLPGNWPGDQGMFPIAPLICFAFLVAVTASACHFLFSLKRFGLLVIVLLITVPLCFTSWPVGRYEYRFHSEHDAYNAALRNKRTFGDQHFEIVRGRRLTYWRWMSWGLDNGIGIIHGPKDQLTVENDDDIWSFRSVTGGVLFTVKRIEPSWYFVTHS